MIETIRVTNRSMPESKLRSVDSGNVFGGRRLAREWARRGNGHRADSVGGPSGVNG
jgi:hypothetical protein